MSIPSFRIFGRQATASRHETFRKNERRCKLQLEKLEQRRVLSTVHLAPIGEYDSGIVDESAAEIVTYDPGSQQLFVTNAFNKSIDVLDISNPANPTLNFSISIETIEDPLEGDMPTSVSVYNGLVAIALRGDDGSDLGNVAFFDVDGNYITTVVVGAQPDMLTFTPNGRAVLTADEGAPTNTDYEPEDGAFNDPVGSVSIVTVPDDPTDVGGYSVTTAGFEGYNGLEDDLRAAGIRIFGIDAFNPEEGASAAQDLEPEYIAVSPDSSRAWISLQENNASATLVLDYGGETVTGEIVELNSFGYKDHSVDGNGLDASDRDDEINITTWPVQGMYQPDGMSTYVVDGTVYLVSANEGDARDFAEARVKDLELDINDFDDPETLQKDENLGRLHVTTTPGDTDGDGLFNELYAYGSRSFSIWEAPLGDAGGDGIGPTLTQTFDSGDDFEQITSKPKRRFNSNNDENGSFDSRSDDKGPEPEYAVVGAIGERTLAFIALERIGGVMVYDVTDPAAPEFMTYRNDRVWGGDIEKGTAGDLGPEGLKFISAEDSPNGKPLLAVANEVSGTTRIYQIIVTPQMPNIIVTPQMPGGVPGPQSSVASASETEAESTAAKTAKAVDLIVLDQVGKIKEPALDRVLAVDTPKGDDLDGVLDEILDPPLGE